MSGLVVQERSGSVRFSVRVQPRTPRSAVSGVHAGVLKVKLSAAPVDGAANDELVELLAEWLGVARRDVRIVIGEKARSKVVEVDGVTADAVRRRSDER
jgi:uncharacterized protein (TIGR00251 family)